MIRRLVAGLIVVGLAVGTWALWPRDDTDPTPATMPLAVETTTTPAPTTSLVATTTTDHQVVTSVEEAEEILRRLWFGWFEGIYHQDEDRIREVVGTQAMLDAAREAFGTMEYVDKPATDGIQFLESEILMATDNCLVVWSQSDASFLGPGEPREGVDVLRSIEGSWYLASTWTHRNDLWEADCEAELDSSF